MKPWDELTRDENTYLVEQKIHHQRNRRIILRRLLDGVCFEPLAEEFDLSVRQVKNIVYKCEDILFRK